MIPQQRALVSRLNGKPFTLLGINSDRDRSGLVKKLESETITWPQIHEGAERAISKKWNVRGYPTIYILDHEGVIRKKGFLSEEEIEHAVDDLLKKAATG
jgi:hypothetical protein